MSRPTVVLSAGALLELGQARGERQAALCV